MNIWTIVVLILLAVVFIAAYVHPTTGWFVRKYLWQILAFTVGIFVTVLLTSLGRKKEDTPIPLNRMNKELDAKLKIIDLEAQLKIVEADTDLKIAEEKHKNLSIELEEAKNIPDVDDRLARLAELSNKVL